VYGLDPNREYEIGLDVVDGHNDEDDNNARSNAAGGGGGGSEETTRIGEIELGEGKKLLPFSFCPTHSIESSLLTLTR